MKRALALAVLFGAWLMAGSGSADTADATRYPYDPVCAWGRIADGRGMLVRCLSRGESEGLRKGGAAAVEPTRPADAGVPADAEVGAASVALEVTVGPVRAENGSLPQAEQKLQKAKDRFAECVRSHGGLTRPDGEVEVRFLVRERGRAEGVEVAKRRGLSEAAARCVADVVDRRAVGLPDSLMVAATLIVRFRRQGK